MSSKQTKNFSSNRNKSKQDLFRLCFNWFREPKQTKNFGWFRLVSVFQTYFETTKTNRTVSKQTKTTLNFLKKYQNMLSIKLFRLLFCLFRFNRNTKTLCFSLEGQKRNNRNKHFVLDSAKTSFGSSFGCFESKLVSKDILFQKDASQKYFQKDASPHLAFLYEKSTTEETQLQAKYIT